MTKIRVHLLDLKSYYSSPAYQLGLLVAYACLEEEVKRNVQFIFTEHSRAESAESIVRTVRTVDADLVAASNYAWNYKRICQVLTILEGSQRRLPKVLLGAPNSAGEFGVQMMRDYPSISAMVEAEGEPGFRDICASLAESPTRDPFTNSRNCVIRAAEGDIIKPNMGHRIESLDEIPSPYLTGILPAAPAPIFYETNRGCPYRCSFCYWGNGNSRVFRMSHDRIREEMEFFAQKKVPAFWIADANFGIFPDDSKIADAIAEINGRYGYPFKHVGVNWAKNSCDRVLEIASTFKAGRMGCTTTLALQSVTPEAEENSRRYSMQPSKFVDLVNRAETKGIDTYTDVIWGLPGESVDEYLNGLDAIISTGVPSILIHQLYLLPGTEFYDDRKKFGLTIVSETGDFVRDEGDQSDYWDYIVVSHPKMSRADMIRGTRLMGVSHLLHNHNLGRVVNFYLARYGIRAVDVFDFFDQCLTGNGSKFSEDARAFFDPVRSLILAFANSVGLDEFLFYRRLSDLVWFRTNEAGRREFNVHRVRTFMRELYRVFAETRGICRTADEMARLQQLVDYNVLISPKPAWQPTERVVFEHDVHRIWLDMLDTALATGAGGSECSSGDRGRVLKTRPSLRENDEWQCHASQVRQRLADLLSETYLAERRGPVKYGVRNPWQIPPSKQTSDWLLSNRSKHCQITDASTQ